MTLKSTDSFYLQKPEPLKSFHLAMRDIILKFDPGMTEQWKYYMPCFCYKGKMFCFLWQNKKTGQPYISIVEGGKIDHPLLLKEKRSRMKIMMLDPDKDIPVKTIYSIFKMALKFYK